MPCRGEAGPCLYDGVQEGDCVDERLPLVLRVDVEVVLAEARVGPLQARLDALRRLVGELDRRLNTQQQPALTALQQQGTLTKQLV